MNSTVLSFGRKVVSHKIFEDFVYYLPIGFVWAGVCGLFFGLDTFLKTFFIFAMSVVGLRFFFSFMTYWINFTQNLQTDLTVGFDKMLEENTKKELVTKELKEKELQEEMEAEVKNKKPKSIPPKTKETVVIQTKRMTLRNSNAGRPGRKPRAVSAENKKET